MAPSSAPRDGPPADNPLRALLEAAPCPLAAYDADLRLEAANEPYLAVWQELAGFAPGVGDLLSEVVERAPAFAKGETDLASRAVRSGGATEGRAAGSGPGSRWSPLPSGGVMHAFLLGAASRGDEASSGSGLPGAGGTEPAGVAELRRHEQAIEESARRARTLIDAGRDALLVYPVSSEGEPGAFVEVNAAACRRYGHSAEEMRRLTVIDISPLDPGWIRDRVRRLVADGSAMFEAVHRDASGRAFPVELSSSVIELDGQVCVLSIARDITDRHAADRALRESEERLRALALASTDLIWTADTDGLSSDARRWLTAFSGVTPPPESTRTWWYGLIHEQDRTEAAAAISAGFSGRAAFMIDFRLRHASGAWRHMELRGVPVLEPDGRLREWVGTLSDVTTVRVADAARRESESRYRTFVESARDAVYVFPAEEDGTPLPFLEVNEEACRRMGYTREQFLRKTYFDLSTYDQATVRSVINRVLAGDTAPVEARHLTADGRTIPTEIVSSVVTFGGRRCVLAMCRDISDRVRTEDAMRRSEERLRLALHAGGMGAWEWDLAAGRALVDDRVLDLFDIDDRDFEGDAEHLFRRVHPEDRAAVEEAVRRSAQGEPYEQTFRVVRRDGRVRWVSGVAAAVREPEGAVTRLVGVHVDVTDRLSAERALRASDARYRTIGDAIDYGVWTCDAAGRCTYVSDSFLRMLGKSWDDVRDLGWADRLSPEAVGPTMEKWERTVREAGSWEQEYRLRAADGSWRTVLSLGRPVRGEDGRVIEWVGLNLDITARKRTEESLRAAERRQAELLELLESLLANAPVGFAFFDRHHRFIRVNQQLAEMNGVSAVDHLDRTLEEVVPSPAKLVGPLIDRVFVTGQPVESVEVSGDTPREGGVRRWWLVSLYPVFAGRESASFVGVVVVEITDRKRAESELRESRDRLEAALEASSTGTFRFDFERGRIDWDDQLRRLFDFSPGESLDSVDSVLSERVHPKDRDRLREALQQRLSTPGESEIEYRVLLPGGGVRWLLDKGRTVAAPDGRLLYLTGACKDITDRKRAAEQQRVLLAELSHRVKNTLATVQSVATQTGRSAGSVEEFRRAFSGRLRALAALHSLLTQSRWIGVPLRELVETSLRPYAARDGANASLHGPDVTLTADAAQPFAMMLHELATNAAKYGALSESGGRVEVRWTLDHTEGTLILRWAEHDGPPIRPPEHEGFGTSLIRQQVAYELAGDVRLDFPPEGVWCSITVPLDAAVQRA